ncbi:MAG: hypothetical protein KKE86_02265 [Planctomycetes bacterium]|nr:hypothetical protein [Planctomycetota bacterium]MBU4398141.1 hypothetical protein [Planctomycetota bacterium]MCG2682357.1 DUF6364 family protein [Planctomycetales bacterium]
MTKLTLSMGESVVKKAKKLAKANHTSVSAMFSQFVESAATRSKQDFKIGPLTRKLSGIIELPPNKNHKELIAEALVEKYGGVK